MTARTTGAGASGSLGRRAQDIVKEPLLFGLYARVAPEVSEKLQITPSPPPARKHPGQSAKGLKVIDALDSVSRSSMTSAQSSSGRGSAPPTNTCQQAVEKSPTEALRGVPFEITLRSTGCEISRFARQSGASAPAPAITAPPNASSFGSAMLPRSSMFAVASRGESVRRSLLSASKAAVLAYVPSGTASQTGTEPAGHPAAVAAPGAAAVEDESAFVGRPFVGRPFGQVICLPHALDEKAISRS